MELDFSAAIDSTPLLLKGLFVTLEVSGLGILQGLVVGVVAVLVGRSRSRALRALVGIYISFIRGTPLLVQILFVYYALPGLTGIDLSPIIAGMLALGFNSGAFVTEILRGGLNSIPDSQFEAARALALKPPVIWARVILPQLFLRVLPPLTNEFTMILKASPLLSVITIVELTRTAQQVMYATYRPVEILIVVAFIYFVVCLGLSTITQRLEARTASRRP